jgi:hypothetical protein
VDYTNLLVRGPRDFQNGTLEFHLQICEDENIDINLAASAFLGRYENRRGFNAFEFGIISVYQIESLDQEI